MSDTPQVQAQDALSAEDLSRLIFEGLRSYVEVAQGGHLSVAKDPLEVLELLGNAPGSFRVIISWNGEKPVLAHGEASKYSGIVENEWKITVSAQRGLPFLTGSNLFLSRNPDLPSLVKRCAEVRERMRGLRFPSRITEQRFTYMGTDPDAAGGQSIDAYTQTYRLKATLPPEHK